MIPAANESRLYLSDPLDLANAACAITCWAGAAKSADIRIETSGNASCFVVDRTWCTPQGALNFTTTDGTVANSCPLGAVAMIPAPLMPCRSAGCKLSPVVTVDASANPVTVHIAAQASDTYRIEWGTGQTANAGVAGGSTTSHTYHRAGTYRIRVYDETSGMVAGPFAAVVATGTADTVTVTCPANTTSRKGSPASLTLSVADNDPDHAAYTWTAAPLPAGVHLVVNGDQVSLTGTPTATQSSTAVTVTATDATGASGTCSFNWTVIPATDVTVTNPGSQSTAVGASVNLALAATDSDSSITTFTWSATGLPAGLSLNTATGHITGTPTTGRAASNVTVTATDSNGGTDSKTFTWAITTAVTITTTIPDQTWTNGVAITNITPAATDTDASITTFTWSISPALPTGVNLNTSTGVISGTPSVTMAQTTYTLTATDALGAAGTKTFHITVS